MLAWKISLVHFASGFTLSVMFCKCTFRHYNKWAFALKNVHSSRHYCISTLRWNYSYLQLNYSTQGRIKQGIIIFQLSPHSYFHFVDPQDADNAVGTPLLRYTHSSLWHQNLFFFFLVYHLLIGAQSLKQRFRSAEQVAALNCKHNFIRSAGYSARMLLHCSTTLPSRRSANFLTHFFGDVNRELIAQINFLSKLAEAPPHSILRVIYTPLWAIQYMDTTKISMAYLSE